jgi:hypothetical protein
MALFDSKYRSVHTKIIKILVSPKNYLFSEKLSELSKEVITTVSLTSIISTHDTGWTDKNVRNE